VVTVLQTTYLIWDLASPVSYQAGNELQLTLGFTAPDAGEYYLLGALFDANLDYLDGTLFGLLVPEGADYAVNDPQYTSIWEMAEGEGVDLPCRLTLDRSDITLGLFLVKMAGESPSLADDEEVGALSAELSAATVGTGLDQVMGAAVSVMMMGMVMAVALKDEEA